eukprot:gene36006-21774_t
MVPDVVQRTVMVPEERVETVLVPGTMQTTVTVGGWSHGSSAHHNKSVAELRALYAAQHASHASV